MIDFLGAVVYFLFGGCIRATSLRWALCFQFDRRGCDRVMSVPSMLFANPILPSQVDPTLLSIRLHQR